MPHHLGPTRCACVRRRADGRRQERRVVPSARISRIELTIAPCTHARLSVLQCEIVQLNTTRLQRASNRRYRRQVTACTPRSVETAFPILPFSREICARTSSRNKSTINKPNNSRSVVRCVYVPRRIESRLLTHSSLIQSVRRWRPGDKLASLGAERNSPKIFPVDCRVCLSRKQASFNCVQHTNIAVTGWSENTVQDRYKLTENKNEQRVGKKQYRKIKDQITEGWKRRKRRTKANTGLIKKQYRKDKRTKLQGWRVQVADTVY